MHVSWCYKKWLVLSGQVWWCAEGLREEQALPEGGRHSAGHCSRYPELTFKPDMSPGLSLRPLGLFQHVLGFGAILRGWLGHIYSSRLKVPHRYFVSLCISGCCPQRQPGSGIPPTRESFFTWRGLFSSTLFQCTSACPDYPLAITNSG